LKTNITECLDASADAQGEGPVASATGEAGGLAAGLPCLYYDNCIEEGRKQKREYVRLTPNQKTIRLKVILAIESMVRKYGQERVGLLTLSFGVPGSGKGSYETWALREQAKSWKFVQNRWHSFRTNVIAKRYADWVCVFEQHRDQVWHLHVVVVTKEDIRTGTVIAVLSDYTLPYWLRRGKDLRNEALAAEWKALREACCHYRFGRAELLPLKKSGEALGFYLAGYLVKTYSKLAAGQRCRLVRFSQSIGSKFRDKFTVHSLGSLIHRIRLRIAARMLGFQDYGDFAEYFGPKWNHLLKGALAGIPMPFRFHKSDFATGVAQRTLLAYAAAPKQYLEAKDHPRVDAVASELLRRLEEVLADSEKRLKLRAFSLGDNTGDGPATESDKQSDLFADPYIPF
jgi:hypothetical protein